MKYSKEQYEEKLVYDLKLHDSEVRGIKFEHGVMTIEISCKGMDLESYFKGIDDVIITICVKDIKKMSFNFLDSTIFVYDFTINKQENHYVISINEGQDMYIEALNYSIDFKEEKEYNINYKKLDDFLKSNK